MPEAHLFFLIKNLASGVQDSLNSRFRWFCMRRAARSEVALPIGEMSLGWSCYCACGGSGIYNGAFGPRPRILRQRRRRKQSAATPSLENSDQDLRIAGELVTDAHLLGVVSELCSNSNDIICVLTMEVLTEASTSKLIHNTKMERLPLPSSDTIELFSPSRTIRRFVSSNVLQ